MRFLFVVNAPSTAFCWRDARSFRRFKTELELELKQSHMTQSQFLAPSTALISRAYQSFWRFRIPWLPGKALQCRIVIN